MGERAFGFAMTPKMYSMMSDRLYTDRIGSVVREVCSNAWDAQKMRSLATGEPIAPFKVTLPTDLEPHFVVEDTGPGMPDAVAQDLYSTLGLSTKENTNDQIGAFGLGSKSPFAVSDTFTVENTYDGVTHFYLCFKAESGLPSLLKTGERNEGRANGVKVMIPAPGYKYSEYKKALMRQLIVMDPKPIINNVEDFNFIEAKRLTETADGHILENASEFGLRDRTVYARMGMVLYPVDTSQVRFTVNIYDRLGYGSAVVLELPIGALEPLPSREGLTYDDNTKKNIIEVYDRFVGEYKKILRQNIENQPSPLEGWRELIRVKNSTGIDFTRDKIFILGVELVEYSIPKVWPTFHHEWEEEIIKYLPAPVGPDHHLYEPGLPDDQQPKADVPTKVKVKKEADYPVFIAEEFTKYDTRLNSKKRKVRGFDHLAFQFLDNIHRGSIKFLFMDEVEPKYRIPRMKSWLNEMGYHETYYVVRVDSRYKGDKLDFSSFVDSVETIQRGTKDIKDAFTHFSKVTRPEPVAKDKNLEVDVPGLGWCTAGSAYDAGFKWYNLEDALALESDEDGNEVENTLVDNIFYVKAFRRDLVDYGQMAIKDFLYSFAYDLNLNVIVVGKSGEGHIKKLEALGIPEFKQWLEKRMADFQPCDTYQKLNSANRISTEHKQLFRWEITESMSAVERLLAADGEFVHPYFAANREIRNILSDDTKKFSEFEYQLIGKLRKKGLIKHVEHQAWHNLLEIDLSTDFLNKLANFNALYPAFTILAEKARYNAECAALLHTYMKDYNRLNGLNPTIDYTQVLESNVI